ncbi:MAG: YraN family protein [Phycisphaerales bacterium]
MTASHSRGPSIPRWRAWVARLWWGDVAEATLGRRGERAAARHLKRLGYKLVRRNLRLPVGEADLLMRDPDGVTLVLVEVKTRLASGPGEADHPPPEASVHAHKRAKLQQIRGALSRDRRFRGAPIRIDVVAVDWPAKGRGRPEIRHFIDAVRG